jgi:hypothetical protein
MGTAIVFWIITTLIRMALSRSASTLKPLLDNTPLSLIFLLNRRTKIGQVWNRSKPDRNFRKRRKSDPPLQGPHFYLFGKPFRIKTDPLPGDGIGVHVERLRLTTYTLGVYTCVMLRTTVFLTEDQIKRLAKAATRKGINSAQLIRIYINAGLDKDKP